MSFARFAVFASVLALCCGTAVADMGRIVVSGSPAKVEESSQKALILHDRREEVLILGTEIGSTAAQPILRFIPFPSEPKVSLAPPDTFDRVAAMLAKYRLRFATRWMTKGGAATRERGVEIVSAERLGSHDVTVLRVRDIAAFRTWIDDYVRSHGLPAAAAYPREEAIVADYVARGFDHFVLDRVDLGAKPRFVEPLAFRFESSDLYYPLLTSNSFGGEGAIELFVVAPVTLCRPGSNDPSGAFRGEDFDLAATPARGRCLGLDAKASTSARLPAEEADLSSIFPEWRAFFGAEPIFLQAIRRVGPYRFEADVRAPLVGEAKALEPEKPTDRPFPGLGDLVPPPACGVKPERGPCKAAFEAWAFDSATGVCKPYLWGGCGDPPPFSTREDCERVCTPR
ncbi:MAG: DUF2330 domain-containing protein [Phyllobacteriaceae bacterium]|nr:DUF2330 domain-containing protein [Phyllobacteriaceae bacterium]